MDKSAYGIMKKCCLGGYMEGLWLCRRALDGDRTRVLVTPNAEMLASRRQRGILGQADILFPDGIGVYMAMRRLGLPLAERSCGIELCRRIFEDFNARKRGLRVFLLGGNEGVSERAAERLSRRYGHLDFCGEYHGYFDPNGTENRQIIKKISSARAELVIVCMGFPRQEKWMLDNRDTLPTVRLMMGLGGSLDVWSGDVPRAPRAVREMGFEWAYRAIKQPERLVRIPSLARFAIEAAVTPKETQRN